ncbi:MAG: cation diffusion facilitator family transporter [Stellaceae bacterium]
MAAAASLSLSNSAAGRLRKRAIWAALVLASLLIGLKFLAWLITGSVALLSSLIDSLLDIAASIVNLLAISHALSPADREHRFGHGKAEPLAVLGQSAFIAGSAMLLIAEAVRRLIRPAPVANPPVGIAVMAFAVVVTVALVAYQRSVVRRTGSLAVTADELHYRGDLVLNGSVILALVFGGLLGIPYLDAAFGAAISLWIVWSAVKLTRLSLTQLMDRELPDAERAQIRAIAEAHPDVSAVHDLRTRAAGPTAFIQLHLEMPGALSLFRAHEIADEVEAELRRAYPHAEILIHEDPAGIEEPRAQFPPKVRA